MSITSSIYDYNRQLGFLDTKATSGEVDKYFIRIFPFSLLAKWPRFMKLMEKKSHLPFAKKVFDERNRNRAYTMMLALENCNKKNGGTNDSKRAYTLMKQEYNSRTRRSKPKKLDKIPLLILVVASLTLIISIAEGSFSWILYLLVLGVLLSLPTISGLASMSIFSNWFQRWWYDHCNDHVGVDDTESKIFDLIKEI
ncbi:MAG: hypothetical protein ACREAD_01790 [Nitrosopumilaceae archaeon]